MRGYGESVEGWGWGAGEGFGEIKEQKVRVEGWIDEIVF